MNTYEPTVTDQNGAPIAGLLVTVNNEISGKTFQRSTDGGGYANVAMGDSADDDRITISVLDPLLRFKGYLAGDAMTVAQANGKFPVSLDPFV